MAGIHLGSWFGWLRVTAIFVFIAALCLAVASIVIAFIPGSPVDQELSAAALAKVGPVIGVGAGVVVDPSGWISFTVHDPSLAQRLLHLLAVLPGLVVVAEIGRRLNTLLQMAQASDPFTAATARALISLAKLTAFGGVGAWIVSQVAQGVLTMSMLDSTPTLKPHGTPAGWLVVALIFAGFGHILKRGMTMRAELDTFI